MTYQQPDPGRGRMAPADPRRRPDPSQRATPRQALWSGAVAIAVVFVLGIVFYQINASDHPRATNAPATTSASSTGTTPAPQTTGRGGQ